MRTEFGAIATILRTAMSKITAQSNYDYFPPPKPTAFELNELPAARVNLMWPGFCSPSSLFCLYLGLTPTFPAP